VGDDLGVNDGLGMLVELSEKSGVMAQKSINNLCHNFLLLFGNLIPNTLAG
jgi:hypothetical protein